MDIIGTLGPSLLTSARINSFIDEGVTIFRVNGAHTDAQGDGGRKVPAGGGVRWIRGVERLVNDESDIRRPRAASSGYSM